MKRRKLILLLILTSIILNSMCIYAAPYPLKNEDKPKITINVEELDTTGDLIYKGVDIALFGAKLGTNEFKLIDDKAQRILTNKTKIEIDLSKINLQYDYNYKIAYRTLYAKAGTEADKLFVAGQGNGKDGWTLVKDLHGEDFIFKVDNEVPTFSSISFTGNTHREDNTYWIKKGNQITVTTKGYDKPSGIRSFNVKVGQAESSLDWETSQAKSITTDNNILISSGTKRELNNYYREVDWKVIGKETSLNDIYIKYEDYSQNNTNYLSTNYKLGVDGIAYKPTISVEEITPTRKKIIINAYDNESGVKSIQYQIGNQEPQTVNKDEHSFIIDYNDYKGTITLDIKAKTTDNVGNVSMEETLTLQINFPPEITINSPKDKYEFKVLEKPIFDVTFKDQDNEKMDVTFEYNGKVKKFKGINNGENLKLEIPEEDWRELKYYKEYIFKIAATDGKITTVEEYPLMKINTPSEIQIIKPADGQYVYQGYINFEWDILEPDNQEYGNAILKVYTDTPNTFNNGLIYHGSIKHGKSNYEAFYYLPEGVHNIYFEITDNKSEVFQNKITVKVDKMVNINIDNGAKTFYIANFDQEKSNIYYNDINNRLTDSIYMLNILGKNGDLNEEYIKKIKNMVNVTGEDNYLNKGDRVYEKSGIDSLKITDWILEKINRDFAINKVIKVTDMLNIESIIFEDEEKDYTSTEPDRGKNRRFQVFHVPTYYDNPDNEIDGNGEWMLDENFIKFDGQEIIKGDKNISFKINKAGKYILNVLEDDEIKNPYGKDFSKTSPDIDYVFYAHRPPKAILRYEENGDGTVKLISSDSFDPDFINSKPNKGIKEVKWEYRELTYTNDIVTDWTEVPDINRFIVDPTYKTFLKLTVKDYGGLKDVDNVLVLEGSETIVFDKTGLPPKANFDINVGTKEETSVDSKGFVYKGKDGAETIQLIDKVLWNDFFAESGTRSFNFTKDKAALNNEVKNGVKKLSTTLNIVNKFNLKDSISKDAVVKNITLNTPKFKTINFEDYPNLPGDLKSKLIAGSQSEIKVTLGANESVSWSDLKVTIQSADLGINKEKEINHEVTNVFSMKHKLPNKENINYIIRVYSRRTNEKLIEQDFNITAISYLTIGGIVDPNKDLFPGDLIDILEIVTTSPIDVTDVKIDLYQGDTLLENIGTISKVIKKDKDKIYWDDYKNYKLPNTLTKGDYIIKLTATDVNGKLAVKDLLVNVIEVEIKNFRITRVYDIRWRDINTYPIYASAMPVERNEKLNPIKVGYKVDFEIDTFGLNEDNDSLYIDVSFLNQGKNQVSPYYINNKNSQRLPISYNSIGKSGSKFEVKRNILNKNNATWSFSYYIPATSYVNGSDKLIIKFDITGKKAGGNPISFNDTNNFDGLTFIYTLKQNALEDYYIRGGN